MVCDIFDNCIFDIYDCYRTIGTGVSVALNMQEGNKGVAAQVMISHT
jgi:hypothetical protein